MAYKLKPKLLKLFTQLRLFNFHQGIQRTRLSAKGISNHVSLTRVVMNTKVIRASATTLALPG
jgi:hypothetical protein